MINDNMSLKTRIPTYSGSHNACVLAEPMSDFLLLRESEGLKGGDEPSHDIQQPQTAANVPRPEHETRLSKVSAHTPHRFLSQAATCLKFFVAGLYELM